MGEGWLQLGSAHDVQTGSVGPAARSLIFVLLSPLSLSRVANVCFDLVSSEQSGKTEEPIKAAAACFLPD